MESLLPLLIVLGFMWLLLIRPQQQRVKAQRTMLSSLAVGDEIVTIGGIYGRIVAIDDESLRLEVADGVTVRLLRAAVRQKVAPDVDVTDGTVPPGDTE